MKINGKGILNKRNILNSPPTDCFSIYVCQSCRHSNRVQSIYPITPGGQSRRMVNYRKHLKWRKVEHACTTGTRSSGLRFPHVLRTRGQLRIRVTNGRITWLDTWLEKKCREKLRFKSHSPHLIQTFFSLPSPPIAPIPFDLYQPSPTPTG